MVRHFIPESLLKALQIKAQYNTVVMAGGTDLMVKYRRGRAMPPSFNQPVLYINQLEELKSISKEEDFINIGAACTLSYLQEHSDVPEVLKKAVSVMASPAVRNAGTIGGNICNASPAGDTLPPLYAMEARVVLQSLGGSRETTLDKFIKGPGLIDIRQDELLTLIKIPTKEFNTVCYRKVGTRKADALSKLSFTGLARTSDGVVEDFRVAFGAVAPTIVKAEEVEKEVRGIKLEELEQMLPVLIAEYEPLIRPIDDQRSSAKYRKAVSLKLLEHFLKEYVLKQRI